MESQLQAPQGEAQQQPSQGTNPQEILERFVLNVMKMASKDQYDQMLSMAKSADNGVQSLGRALLLIVSAVKKGLENKGVEIPPEMWLAKNGILDQSTKIVAVLLDKAGVKMSKEDIPEAMEMVAETLVAQDKQGRQQPQEEEQPQAQQPQPQQQAQPQPQQGLLQQGGI